MKTQTTSQIINTIKVIALALLLALGISYVSAQWSGPQQAPPGGNVPAPINIGPLKQIKTGDICTTFGTAGPGTGTEKCLGTINPYSPGMQTFNSNGTFIVPVGVNFINVAVWGGGGGAGSNTYSQNYDHHIFNKTSGGGGGSGYYTQKIFQAVTPAQSISVTIGAGGGGGAQGLWIGLPYLGLTFGATGGTSSVAGIASAGGGSGGRNYIEECNGNHCNGLRYCNSTSYASGGNVGGTCINSWSQVGSAGGAGVAGISGSAGAGGGGTLGSSAGNPGFAGKVVIWW